MNVKKKNHILFVCHEYPPVSHGGIGSFIKSLAEELVKRGFAISIVGFYKQKESNCSEIVNGVIVNRLRKGTSKFGRLFNKIYLYYWIEKYIKANKVDIVEYPDYLGDLFIKHTVSTVIRLHGSCAFRIKHGYGKIGRITFLLEKRSIKLADYIVGVSNYVLEYTLKKISNNKKAIKKVIYNFADTDVFKPLYHIYGNSSNIILYFGSLSPYKGVIKLAEAANIFLKDLDDALLIFLGRDLIVNGVATSQLIKKAIHKNFHSRIEITNVDSPDKLSVEINKSRICVLPSYFETFGLTIVEAMACGKAVITSNLCAMKEIITNDVNGILINPDNVDALAEQIIRLYKNNKLQDNLASNALKTVKIKFEKSIQINENIKFYLEVMKNVRS